MFLININTIALHNAIEKGNLEIVKLLVEQQKIDINYIFVFIHFFFYKI